MPKDSYQFLSFRGPTAFALRYYAGAHGEYTDAVEVASRLDAVVKARASGEVTPRAAGSVSTLYWWYQCTLQPYLAKALAITMAVLSGLIVWSESTLRFDWINISPLAAVRPYLVAHSDDGECLSLLLAYDSFGCRLCIETAKVQPKSSCWSQVRKPSLH